ncbi:MAG: BON domain-containing protein [Blastocatellia bacterium]
MARDYDHDRWGRRYDDEVERYDRDDRRQRMRSDLDYGRERGAGGSYDRERGMGQYGARNYSDNEVDYRRDYDARRSDIDYGSGGRSRASDRERSSGRDVGRDYGRDYDRDMGVRGWRGTEDDRLRYRGDDRETGRSRYTSDYDRDRYANDYDRNRYSREDDRSRSRRGARDDSWVEQVPDHYSRRGPYEDYGWEAGESVLPEFRDPSVQEADYERRRPRRNDRSWWERTREEVSSWFGGSNREGGREDERDEDARGGHRGRGPRDYRRGDDRIREEINDRMTDDDFLDASQIEVGVQNGEVILAGYVFNRTSKRRAEQLAERVSGVTNVENRLRVIPYGATAANNWDMRQNAGTNQATDTTAMSDTRDENDTTNTSASVTAGNRSS